MPLLTVENLTIGFRRHDGEVNAAVKGIHFSMERGEGLAVVGESGSGKSVTALSLARLLEEPPAVISGRILLEGTDVLSLRGEALRKIRGQRIAYIFQEPGAALNPVFSVRSQITEVLRAHRPEVKDTDAECIRWLEEVGITEPARRLGEYPHQLSGGMQQRVMIAMALAAKPDILVADEPTTALDVTIQQQIIALLTRLRKEYGMAVILITHNFGIIRGVADRVAVMFRGHIVEDGPVDQVLRSPRHPYTKALIDCIPRPGSGARRLAGIDHEALAALVNGKL
ncbi:MAG TPA: ABC transporter ATP-binding protein [Verrucomicrobiales bacterium]|nr:ABC transporter ATP-binding protein [Verrucomicrobiales bacterium]